MLSRVTMGPDQNSSFLWISSDCSKCAILPFALSRTAFTCKERQKLPLSIILARGWESG